MAEKNPQTDGFWGFNSVHNFNIITINSSDGYCLKTYINKKEAAQLECQSKKGRSFCPLRQTDDFPIKGHLKELLQTDKKKEKKPLPGEMFGKFGTLRT